MTFWGVLVAKFPNRLWVYRFSYWYLVDVSFLWGGNLQGTKLFTSDKAANDIINVVTVIIAIGINIMITAANNIKIIVSSMISVVPP